VICGAWWWVVGLRTLGAKVEFECDEVVARWVGGSGCLLPVSGAA
jgi:hypothetical protein